MDELFWMFSPKVSCQFIWMILILISLFWVWIWEDSWLFLIYSAILRLGKSSRFTRLWFLWCTMPLWFFSNPDGSHLVNKNFLAIGDWLELECKCLSEIMILHFMRKQSFEFILNHANSLRRVKHEQITHSLDAILARAEAESKESIWFQVIDSGFSGNPVNVVAPWLQIESVPVLLTDLP